MTRRSSFVSIVLLAILAVLPATGHTLDAPPLGVSRAELDAAIARQQDSRADDRARIRTLLQREDVRALAEGQGLDLRRAEAAVDTLEDSELQALAQQAAQVDAALQGGDLYVRMSLIALLLIIIIVILLAD